MQFFALMYLSKAGYNVQLAKHVSVVLRIHIIWIVYIEVRGHNSPSLSSHCVRKRSLQKWHSKSAHCSTYKKLLRVCVDCDEHAAAKMIVTLLSKSLEFMAER